MTLIRHHDGGWHAGAPEPVGPPETLLHRLHDIADGGAVAFGIDCPIGLPRAYASRHTAGGNFPAFLKSLARDAPFLDVADHLGDVSAARPFYPMRGVAGMTRLSHALALGLGSADDLCRACDRATNERPAGAPVFWTLGANQSGKAAIAAWRDVIIPGLLQEPSLRLWPFEGGFLELLAPGVVVMAETYPAEAMQQLGLRRAGSKRRQSDRIAYAPFLREALSNLRVEIEASLEASLTQGFGAEASGEDKMDCLLGALCVLSVVAGARPDTVPKDPWVQNWEGWVLAQALP